MNTPVLPPSSVPVTLKDVLDRLAANSELSDTRKLDLRSAVVIYGKLKGEPLSAIPLDLVAIRRTLDGIVPAQAKVSRKRWANMRSDLAAALESSGLRPMLKTADIGLDGVWTRLLAPADLAGAMAFRVSPDGRACAGSAPKPSTRAP